MTPEAGFRCNLSSKLATCPPDMDRWNMIGFWALGLHPILSHEFRGWPNVSCNLILTAKI
jgi:hypothetical protein